MSDCSINSPSILTRTLNIAFNVSAAVDYLKASPQIWSYEVINYPSPKGVLSMREENRGKKEQFNELQAVDKVYGS